MSEPRACPFCTIDPARIVDADDVALAARDGYPVNPGRTLVIPRRHVATWFEATEDEQRAIMALVARVNARLDEELHPDGCNVGINVGEAAGHTVMHLHMHVIPRFRGDVDDPRGGVRLVIPSERNYKRPGYVPRRRRRGVPIASGGREDSFLPHILPLLREAREVATLSAFVQGSGADCLHEELGLALRRGARVRALTGDYLDITQARALRGLFDLVRGREAEVAEADESGADRRRGPSCASSSWSG
jgi:diadenosine tetraphosphate (Ap4A) HIT family hydrolase